MKLKELREMQNLAKKLFKSLRTPNETYKQMATRYLAKQTCNEILESLASSVGWALLDDSMSRSINKEPAPELWFPKDYLHWLEELSSKDIKGE